MHYIGFVVDGLVPSLLNCLKNRSPFSFISGWSSSTAIAVMRYGWIAAYINNIQTELQYELYRPWRRYAVVVFLKSMGSESIRLMHRLNKAGVPTIFDVNVDYLTPASGTFFFEGMAPEESQREAALAMINGCGAVIGDSDHITSVARKYASNVITIEDNVKNSLIAKSSDWYPDSTGKLTLLWSGQATKLFELLAVKKVLLNWKKKIHLKIITNSLSAMNGWYPAYKKEFECLLQSVSHEIIDFTNIYALMDIYDSGGVFISPRFLNNTYNLGHTEWKITLPMARGRIVLCSSQQSYRHVNDLSCGKGIRVCTDDQDWHYAFSEITSSSFNWQKEQQEAIRVVRENYSTQKIAAKHLRFVKQLTI